VAAQEGKDCSNYFTFSYHYYYNTIAFVLPAAASFCPWRVENFAKKGCCGVFSTKFHTVNKERRINFIICGRKSEICVLQN
jgi:hypothetical protein